MTRLTHSIRVPYPPRVLVEQHFDFEHLPHAHPRTLGRAEVVEIGGRRVVADLRFPILGSLRGRSRFRQVFVPADRVEVEVVAVKMCRGDLPGIEAAGIPPSEIVACGRSALRSGSARERRGAGSGAARPARGARPRPGASRGGATHHVGRVFRIVLLAAVRPRPRTRRPLPPTRGARKRRPRS